MKKKKYKVVSPEVVGKKMKSALVNNIEEKLKGNRVAKGKLQGEL